MSGPMPGKTVFLPSMKASGLQSANSLTVSQKRQHRVAFRPPEFGDQREIVGGLQPFDAHGIPVAEFAGAAIGGARLVICPR